MVEAGAQLKKIGAYFGGKATRTVRAWMGLYGVHREKRPQRRRDITPRWLGVAFSPGREKRFSCKLYEAWQRLSHVCTSKNPRHYRRFGARGIKVSAEWSEYAAFREWSLANGFGKGLTFQRINADGDFEPSNCRWSTWADFVHHTRGTEWITYNGETLPSPIWAKRLGLHPQHLRQRLNNGWSVEEALTVPKGQLRPGRRRGRTPYPPELHEAIAAHRALERAIKRSRREEQDQ